MAVFVLLTLATVTFDGISETSAWLEVQEALHPTISPLPVDTFGTIDTLGLLVIPAFFLTVFLGFSWVLRLFEGTTDTPVFDVAKVFVLSLVPIALAYNMAHFISLITIQGQGIIPLLSDPFGFGWDLFGTAELPHQYQPNYRWIRLVGLDRRHRLGTRPLRVHRPHDLPSSDADFRAGRQEPVSRCSL